MTKRLIWNFEIDSENPFDFQTFAREKDPLLRWESRFFWSEQQIITLHGLDSIFMDLSQSKVKQRKDIYYLFSNHDYNIKQRRDAYFYKPLLKNTKHCQGFAAKINLSTCIPEEILPGTAGKTCEKLLSLAKNEAKALVIVKTVIIYKLPTTPAIKLELGRLQIHNEYYFSVCIEGRSADLVDIISTNMIKGAESCNYVNFLQKITHDK